MRGRPVIVRRYDQDRFGDRIEVSRHTVTNAAFAPRPVAGGRSGTEFNDRASTVLSDAELYVPFGADIRSDDEIELEDGTLWEVNGHPERWESPWNLWRPGSVVPLHRKTG